MTREEILLAMRGRADRLVRLIDLEAPSVVIENEIKLVEQAAGWFREKTATNDNHEHIGTR